MPVSIEMITVDCRDAEALGAWWAEQTGGRVVEENDGWFVVVKMAEGQPVLGFQRVDDPTPGKNRMHLDVTSDDVDAEVSRLVSAGATHESEHTMGELRWVTLADPEGNLFCVGGGH
ncbi:VOC family protein [Nocardioides sp. AE5]|uniref:VOC family protein n=1 Tax=Nocardioides sp. AE5 TaxID=2962573 RepID=UPI002880D7AB|nr:VOC family protein [Nocardioides sp. AE5]MDT0200716.1 VOC family protein [Nocardioides sp. AE5]